MEKFAHPEVLVSTDWVNEHRNDPGIRLIEIDVDTQAYDAGHIPGAVGFNWQTQLQDQVRRDIKSKEEFEDLLGSAGVSRGDTVILYGDNNNWFAAYGFWLFKIYGHDDVRLMDGGRQKWLDEDDKELVVDLPTITPDTYEASSPDTRRSNCHRPADGRASEPAQLLFGSHRLDAGGRPVDYCLRPCHPCRGHCTRP